MLYFQVLTSMKALATGYIMMLYISGMDIHEGTNDAVHYDSIYVLALC